MPTDLLHTKSRLQKAVGVALGVSMTVGVVLYLLWEGRLRYYSTPSRVSVVSTIAAILIVATLLGHGRQIDRSRLWSTQISTATREWRSLDRRAVFSVVVWILLFVAIVGWDLYSFSREVHQLPTLSYLIGRVTRFSFGRSAVYALWLLAGFCICIGHRRPRSRLDTREGRSS
ncbi:MAG: hypothetical protein M1134_06240 [Actinobacteria bacterium]|nr:hypothetical protein [Actinomycetota bacterium]MCL5444614.1 hypothetical protein [Actinomycetota bacterium]